MRGDDVSRRRLEPWAVVAVAMAFCLALPAVFVQTTFWDEVSLLGHTRRLLEGQVMYRDFFEFLAPLTSWLAAPLFAVVGPSVQAARVLTAFGLALASWQLYRLSRQLALPGPLAALPGIFLVGVLYDSEPGYSQHWIIQPLMWGAVLAVSTGMDRPPGLTGKWLTAGVATGLACLTAQTDGVALAAALVLWTVLDAWLGETPVRDMLARVGALLGGLAISLGLAAAFMACQGGLAAALRDALVWPLRHYGNPGGMNDVKYMTALGTLLSTTQPDFKLWKWYVNAFVQFYVWLVPPGLAALVLARAGGLALARVRAKAPWNLETARLALVAVVMVAFLAVFMKGKGDFDHAICYMPAAVLVGTLLAWRWRALMPGEGLLFVRWLPLASLLVYGAASLALIVARFHSDPNFALQAAGPDGHMRREPLVAYLRAQARPGDRLIVYPLGNLYYFCALPPATRFTSMLDPSEGYYDAADYALFWQEAAASHARFMVFAPIPLAAAAPKLTLAGYTLVKTLAITSVDQPCLAYVYDREAAARPSLGRR